MIYITSYFLFHDLYFFIIVSISFIYFVCFHCILQFYLISSNKYTTPSQKLLCFYHNNNSMPWKHLTNFMSKKVINLKCMRIRSKLILMNNFLFHKFFIFSSTSSDLVILVSVWSWRRNFPKRLLLSKNRIDWFIMVRTST